MGLFLGQYLSPELRREDLKGKAVKGGIGETVVSSSPRPQENAFCSTSLPCNPQTGGIYTYT